MRRARAEQAQLITSAPQSSDHEFEHRRKRYLIMMMSRIVCVIAAASVYRFSILLALAFVIAGAVLPWCAVLIANDRPPRKRARRLAYGARNGEAALPGESDRTVDG